MDKAFTQTMTLEEQERYAANAHRTEIKVIAGHADNALGLLLTCQQCGHVRAADNAETLGWACPNYGTPALSHDAQAIANALDVLRSIDHHADDQLTAYQIGLAIGILSIAIGSRRG